MVVKKVQIVSYDSSDDSSDDIDDKITLNNIKKNIPEKSGKKKFVIPVLPPRDQDDSDEDDDITIIKSKNESVSAALPVPKNSLFARSVEPEDEESVTAPYPIATTTNLIYTNSTAASAASSKIKSKNGISELDRKLLDKITHKPHNHLDSIDSIKTINQKDQLDMKWTEKAHADELRTKEKTREIGGFDHSDNQRKKHNIQWLMHTAKANKETLEERYSDQKRKRAESRQKYGY